MTFLHYTGHLIGTSAYAPQCSSLEQHEAYWRCMSNCDSRSSDENNTSAGSPLYKLLQKPRQMQGATAHLGNESSVTVGLSSSEVSHIIVREPDDKANSYEHVKDLLLKRFKLTPEKFRQLFVTHQKAPEKYYLDEWANMNSPVQLEEKLEEFEDFKRTLKQKSSCPFVKKEEFKFTEKNRRYEAPGKFDKT
ncbi:uncharacterized protein TNCV_2751321 [Trichonephila clavipes]|nr:uncharacterized protein TNCV_2751321 [Trichonephila clavipes]